MALGPEQAASEPSVARLSHTSPSAEDLQRGLSSGITVVLPEEEQKRVYVGTVEGRAVGLRQQAGSRHEGQPEEG